MKIIRVILVCLSLSLVSGFVCAGTIIYVDDDNTTAPWDGTQGHPYQYIQDGIDAAVNGDTVLVADGVYSTSKGIRNVNLNFGGRAITVESENGAENCVIDCENADDTCGFRFRSGEASDSVVNGFTIRNGKATSGAGIDCYDSSPTITNNVITGNSAERDGGGICCSFHSSPTIINNTITANSANAGGGIYCSYDCSPTIINNTITGNLQGSGIFCDALSSLTIINTILWNDNPQEIYFGSDDNIATISYSDIQGGRIGIVTNNSLVNWLEGNMNSLPLFFDAANGNYHLSDHSPCIGAGTSTGAPIEDMEGNPRGIPPDMGAYENNLDAPLPREPIEIYVSLSGDDTTGDGSQAKPYGTIQKGINEALDGDTVLVADGIYTGSGNVNLDFGTRAITLRSENGAANCIIDCEYADDTRGFYFHDGEIADSVLNGFTIRNGKATNGGGIYCISSCPTITNNIIMANSANAGGGVYCTRDASPIIVSNTISANAGGESAAMVPPRQ